MKAASSINRMTLPSPPTVWCVGRNYKLHIQELPNLLNIKDDLPEEPLIFIKAASTILKEGHGVIRLPSWTRDVQHECELGIGLGDNLEPKWAAIAIDLTARDTQALAKAAGFPWSQSKSFATSCPLGSVFSLEGVDVQDITLELKVNNQVRQRASTADMIFSVRQIISYLIQNDFPIVPGDLILTGTPSGVGRVADGDRVTATASRGDLVLSKGEWVAAQESEGGDPLAWRND